MTISVIKANTLFLTGALLVFPAASFIFISILKYNLGLPYFFDYAEPLLERMGIKESLGFNINMLILLGPVIALLLNLFVVLNVEWYNEEENFSIKISVHKHWWSLVLVIFSGLLLAYLFIYAIGENCHC